jgi:hypothetical protein
VDWYPHRIGAPRYSERFRYPGMASTRPHTSVLYNQVAELLFPSHPRVQIEGDVLGHHSLLRAEGAQTDTKKRTKIILELLSPWKTDMVYILIP